MALGRLPGKTYLKQSRKWSKNDKYQNICNPQVHMVNASDPAVLEGVSHLLYYSQSLDQSDGILLTTL